MSAEDDIGAVEDSFGVVIPGTSLLLDIGLDLHFDSGDWSLSVQFLRRMWTSFVRPAPLFLKNRPSGSLQALEHGFQLVFVEFDDFDHC